MFLSFSHNGGALSLFFFFLIERGAYLYLIPIWGATSHFPFFTEGPLFVVGFFLIHRGQCSFPRPSLIYREKKYPPPRVLRLPFFSPFLLHFFLLCFSFLVHFSLLCLIMDFLLGLDFKKTTFHLYIMCFEIKHP